MEAWLAYVGIIILGIIGLVTTLKGIFVSFVYFRMSAGAGQYVQFTPRDLMLMYVEISYFIAVAIVNLFISIGLFLRIDWARIACMVLSPIPLLGAYCPS